MKLWLGFLEEGEYQWEQLVGRDAGSTLFWLVHRHLESRPHSPDFITATF